jgi:hypothetical protein
MKRIFRLIPIMVLAAGLTVLSSCGGDDPTPVQTMTKRLIAHPWELSSATVDGTDETTLYNGLTITFTETGFTTTNGGVVWPPSGTWEFIDKSAKIIIRNDDLQIEILESVNTSLKLGFTWTSDTFGPGRVGSVAGNHVLTFVE